MGSDAVGARRLPEQLSSLLRIGAADGEHDFAFQGVSMSTSRLWRAGGLAGVASIVCYGLAVLIPWPENQVGLAVSLVVLCGFPVLGIVGAFALADHLAADGNTVAARLSFVFAATAFATLLGMLFVQVAINSGIAEMARGLPDPTVRALRRALRLVDLGLDVAWDILIGTALVLWGSALHRRKTFGRAWAYPSVAFGVLLIGLNVATFPWPPATRGLFDIGPFIAVFMLALNARLAVLGARSLPTGHGPAVAAAT